jgi:chaperonin cofactor prefoldin
MWRRFSTEGGGSLRLRQLEQQASAATEQADSLQRQLADALAAAGNASTPPRRT